MAEFTDTIRLIVETVTDQASSSLASFKANVGEAEGAMGKVKAAGSSAFQTISDNAGAAAAGAGAAIGAFVVKAVGHFEELALSAEDFSTAAGTSVEDASRWIKISDDLGVSADTVQGAMQRLNREAATGKLAGFGIDAQNANDRLIDTLTYLSNIPNEADRSQAAFQIFGKQGTSALAPLLANVGDLKQRLADVSGGQLITDAQVGKAKDLRDATAQLSDDWDSFMLDVGSSVAPFVTALARIGDAADKVFAAKPQDGSLWSLVNGSAARDLAGKALSSLGDLIGVSGDAKSAQDNMAGSVDAANKALQDQQQAATDANKALQDLLTATLGMFNAQLGLSDAGDKAQTAIEAWTTAADAAAASGYTNVDANQKMSDAMGAAEKAALTQAAAAAQLAQDTATATGASYDAHDAALTQASVLETLAGTLGANDPLRANLLAYAAQLEQIPPTKNTTITADTSDADKKVGSLLGTIQSIVLKPWTVKIGATTSAPAPSGSAAAAGRHGRRRRAGRRHPATDRLRRRRRRPDVCRLSDQSGRAPADTVGRRRPLRGRRPRRP